MMSPASNSRVTSECAVPITDDGTDLQHLHGTKFYEAIIVGSGFGGAINACRLSKKWPRRVLVLERGKRYPLGAFPRTPHAIANNFWNTKFEKRSRPKAVAAIQQRGLFDIRNYENIDVVLSAGLGGGSLIYANVFLEPPDEVFTGRWPKSCQKAQLQPYYKVCKEVLGARPVPPMKGRRRIVRTELFQTVARKIGRDSSLVDINVFFGNDFANPLEPGVQEKNRYGALQASCTYCGECDVGCNYQAKNTLDLNYLYRAESSYGAEIRTEHFVDRIVPVNEIGGDDPAASGEHGYRVYFRNLAGSGAEQSELARRVVVSAGSLGSTELLLRCRNVFGTLPRISSQLGRNLSGNGDFLGFVVGCQLPADPNFGPVITQRIDFNMFKGFDSDRAFIIEDASYPAFGAWFVEGAKPRILWLTSLRRTIRHWVARLRGRTLGPIGFAFSDLLKGDLSHHTCVLLCMGIDSSNGVMTLRDGWLDVTWPTRDNRLLYDTIIAAAGEFCREANARYYFSMPTWWWPFRKNVTVHALGGCALSERPEDGVTSAGKATFGEVHGYQRLYVSDGAILPTAVGANPTATISALSEMVAEGITCTSPTAEL
jgi:cholesterol oxidase